MANDSSFSSWPYTSRCAFGFMSPRRSVATASMPPVPHAGSNRVRTAASPRSAWSSSMNSRSTMSRITSRGVKCSPAVSLDCSEKRRISSSYR